MRKIFLIAIILLLGCEKEDDMSLMTIISSFSNQTQDTIFSLPTDGVYVLLLTGQSNAEGRALNSNALASEIDATSDVQIWTGSVWANLDISAGNNESGTGTHGRELGISQSPLNGEPIYLVKMGSSGTEIAEHLSGGSVYEPYWIDVKAAINNLIGQGKRPFVFLSFHQGEADGSSTATADAYASNLDTWVNLWRTNLGTGLPITVTEIKESLTDSYKINDAFDAKALTDSNFEVIAAKDKTTIDGVHLDYDAQKEVGVANKVLMNSMTPIEITSAL